MRGVLVDNPQRRFPGALTVTAEGNTSADIREYFAALGWRLWRNNVGVARDETGRVIRYGLANDSKAENEQIKSGDLIGWAPVLVTPDMVGDVVAVFVSIEVKRPGWRFRPSDLRAVAQRRWADMIRREGGWAGFMVGVDREFLP